jgi:putative transposase
MIYAFIKSHRKSSAKVCVARLKFHAVRSMNGEDPPANWAIEDERLTRLIWASFKASHGVYGGPRILLDLRESGETCSKHCVARRVRENQIRAAHGYCSPQFEGAG